MSELIERLETGIAAAVHEIDELRAENTRLNAVVAYAHAVRAIAGHAPAGTRNGLNACTCGVATSIPWEEHVVDSIQRDVIQQTAIDTCAHCGDLVITHDGETWSHYRGPGQKLNRCQHTVPYGVDAEPAHGGEYAKSNIRETAKEAFDAGYRFSDWLEKSGRASDDPGYDDFETWWEQRNRPQ